MNLRKITALVVAAGLALSLIGAGVGATFTATTTPYQHITVGGMVITAAPAACPDIHVTTSSGSESCTLTLTSTGDIMPTSFSMTPSISGTSLSEPGLWTISDGTGQYTDLATLAKFAYGSFTSGGTVTYTITWANLGDTSMGNDFYVTFNIVGYE
jgi:hypothetical protein